MSGSQSKIDTNAMGGSQGSSGAGYPGDVSTRDMYMPGSELPPWLSAGILDPQDEAFLQKDQWFNESSESRRGRFRKAYVAELRKIEPGKSGHTDADRIRAFEAAIVTFPGGELHPINMESHASIDAIVLARGAEGLFGRADEALKGRNKGSEATVKVSDGKVTVEVPRSMIEMLVEYNARHPGHEISVSELPKYFFGASGIKTQKDLMGKFQKNFTTENFIKWLETDKGRQFIARNEAALGKNFKQRLATTGPSLLVSVAGLLTAEEMADIIGLDHAYHPQERFAFVVYSMHGSGKLGRMGMQRVMRWRAGTPIAEIEGVSKTTMASGGEAIEFTLKARTPFGLRVFSTAIKNLTAGRAAMLAAKGAYGIVKMPVTAGFHMGGGLLAQDVTLIGLDHYFPEMSHDAKSTLGFAGFMVPEGFEGLAGQQWKVALAKRTAKVVGTRAAEGLGAVASGAGRLVGGIAVAESIAFVSDTGLALGDRAVNGDASVYRRDVDMRAAYMIFEREEKRGYGLKPWEKSVRNFLAGKMPTITSFVWGDSVDMNTKAEIYHQDELDSKAVHHELPEQMQQVLFRGVGDERETAEFYTAVHFDRLQDEIELEGDVLSLYEFIERVKRDPSLAGVDRGETYKKEIESRATALLDDEGQREKTLASILEGLKRDGEIAPTKKDAQRIFDDASKRKQVLGYLKFQLKNDDFDARLTLPASEICDDPKRRAQVLSAIMQHLRFEGQEDVTKEEALKILQDSSRRAEVVGYVRNQLRGEAVKAAIVRKSEHLFRDENAREAAFREIDAYELQRNFAAMANIDLALNGDFAHFLDHDGSVENGSEFEETFLWAAFSDRKHTDAASISKVAKEARQEILDTRRAQLILRIWDADGDERMRLMVLAEDAKMTDGAGELKRSDPYLFATAIWARRMKSQGETGRKTVEKYARSLQRRIRIARNYARAKGLKKEWLVLNAILKGDVEKKANNNAKKNGGSHG